MIGDYAVSLMPRWLEPATHDLRSIAAPLDDVVIRARTVALARLISDAPEDALTMIGEERGLTRYPNEPASIYRSRVQGAWEHWALAGTLPGMTRILLLAGWKAQIVEHFRDRDGRWAEFSVHVQPARPLERTGVWGRGRWDSGASHWGYRIDALPLSSLVEFINEIKPGHARLRTLSFSVDGTTWGSDATWGTQARRARSGWGLRWSMPPIRSTGGKSPFSWGDGRTTIIYTIEEGADHE